MRRGRVGIVKDYDGGTAEVRHSSGVQVGEHAGPFVWLTVRTAKGHEAFVHLTERQAASLSAKLSRAFRR